MRIEDINDLSPDILALNPELTGKSGVARTNKYNAHVTNYRGRDYPSKAQANYIKKLDLRVKGGDVICYTEEVTFPLAGGIKYRADVVVVNKDWSVDVVDVKGMILPSFKLKRKLFKEKYGRDIVIVK